MKENFSQRVQLIIKNAKEEAIRLGHSYVGSEHLLLGLLREKSGLSSKIFDIYDCDISDVQSMIEDMIKTLGNTMTLGHLPLTRRAERILRNAFNEAAALGSAIADDEHLLLAILKENEGIAREIVNRIQNIRKSKGLEVTDKIEINIKRSTTLENAINSNLDYVKGETLAIKLYFSEKLDEGEIIEFDNITTTITINKV